MTAHIQLNDLIVLYDKNSRFQRTGGSSVNWKTGQKKSRNVFRSPDPNGRSRRVVSSKSSRVADQESLVLPVEPLR